MMAGTAPLVSALRTLRSWALLIFFIFALLVICTNGGNSSATGAAAGRLAHALRPRAQQPSQFGMTTP